jgi:hypothetical protein
VLLTGSDANKQPVNVHADLTHLIPPLTNALKGSMEAHLWKILPELVAAIESRKPALFGHPSVGTTVQLSTLASASTLLKLPGFSFKSTEQAEATQLALERKKNLLVILPTGGGKTLVYQVPAFVESEATTVIVVPLVALVKDLHARCLALGLPCAEWNSSRLGPLSAGIVLVSVESATSAEFIR